MQLKLHPLKMTGMTKTLLLSKEEDLLYNPLY
jgi:hypothetical protein